MSILTDGLTSAFPQVKVAIAAVIIAIFAGLLGGVWYYKHSYEEELQQTAAIKEQNSQLQATLQQVNEDNQKFIDAQAKKLADAQAALVAAQAEAKKNKGIADTFLARQVPQGVSTCDAANSLYNDYLTNYKDAQ